MRIVVNRTFNFDHRPTHGCCTTLKVKPDVDFQTVKQVVGEAAIAAGAATIYKPVTKSKPEIKENDSTRNAGL